jgi:hypothetical protein
LVALFWHKEGRKPTRLVVSEIRFICSTVKRSSEPQPYQNHKVASEVDLTVAKPYSQQTRPTFKIRAQTVARPELAG